MDMSHSQHMEEDDLVRSKEMQLERMRVLQAKLASAWEHEIARQKAEDAKAQELMKRDPSGHIEMMKMEQEHRQLALELPQMLLEREAEVYAELQRAQKAAAAKQPEAGKLMGQMIPMERWSQIPLLALGLWLIFSPFTAGYSSLPLILNDIVSGILVITFAIVVLRTRRSWAAWANTVVGAWLAFAPVLFWAPDAAIYMNDTLVGVLIFTFSVLVPMRMRMPGPEVPLGWSYNPSTWMQRAPALALALLAFLMTQYMAAYQLGHIDWAWDPFFGDGTVTVLTSSVSMAFPVSDAGWGAWIYLIELLSGFMGDTTRWRTMPWMVALFGLLVVPLGIASIALMIMQPVVVGAWCTICLITAFLMVVMITLSIDEILAMLGYMAQIRRAGKPLWRTFWYGGDALGDRLTPRRPEKNRLREMFWGITVPWNLVVVAVLGGWLMAAPAVFQTQGLAADINYVLGAVVWVMAIIALAEVVRAARFVNILAAIALMILPWLLLDGSSSGMVILSSLNNLVVGAVIIVLSIPLGKIKNTYVSWNRLII
jgi:Vitamin K epoxide reductase family/SPW repeat